MAGRPLTGSFEQLASGAWKASVPECRGSRRRVSATFPTLQAAEAWVSAAIADICSGLRVTAPDPLAAAGTHWLATAADKWFESKYRLAQRAGPERADAVRAHLDRYILPFFTSRWLTPADVSLEDCEIFMLNLAGRCRADGTSVIGTDERLPAVSLAYAGEVKRTLKAVLDHAVARKVVDHNPAHALAPSRFASLGREAAGGRSQSPPVSRAR